MEVQARTEDRALLEKLVTVAERACIVANTLRMFGQGTKVCVEIAMMALDAGTIEYGKPVIAVGGSGRGADTVCRLTPEYTSDLMGTRIHAFLCKPSLEE